MSVTEWLNAHGGWFVGVALAAAFLWLARRKPAAEVTETAHGRIQFLWLMEEDPAHRLLLRQVLDIIEGGKGAEEVMPQEIIAALARQAFREGDPRSGMLESFAAAANHSEHSAAIERKIWEILEGGDEMSYRCERIKGRDLR